MPLIPEERSRQLKGKAMGRLRRATGVIFAIGVGIGAGLLFLPMATLIDPVTRAPDFALLELAIAAMADADFADSSVELGFVLTSFVTDLISGAICWLLTGRNTDEMAGHLTATGGRRIRLHPVRC
jgi:hypothetical protein